MNDNETTADVIAAMRDEAARADMEQEYSIDDAAEMMREFAWRLEAAHKRERGVAVTGSNQLREALRLCMGAMCKYCVADAEARGMTTECVHGCEALLKAKAALAAPPRNCDVIGNTGRALAVHGFPTKSKPWGEGEWLKLIDWLFATATEQEGGDK